VNFLLTLIELFSLGVTAEALWAKIDRKSAISLQSGHFDPKCQVEGVAPPVIFARIVRPMNVQLQLFAHSFRTKKLCSKTFFKRSAILHRKRPFCVFEPQGGIGPIGATYDDHLRLIRKCVVNFLLALIELFSLGVKAEALRANIGSK